MNKRLRARWEDRVDTVATLQQFRAQERAEVESLLDLLADRHGVDPERVLDIGCGVGRFAVPFAEAGCRVHGMDLHEPLLEQARDRAADAGVTDRVEFYIGDHRELDTWSGVYDVVSLFDMIGFYDRAVEEQVFEHARSLLASDGVVVATFPTKEHVIDNMWGSDVEEFGDCLRIGRFSYDVESSTRDGVEDLFRVDDDGYSYVGTLPSERRLYSPPFMGDLFRQAGFDSVSLYADFEGEPVTLDSELAVLVAQ